MRWRDLLGGGKPPPHSTPPRPAAPAMRLTLHQAPTLTPLPINPADPLDRLIATHWHASQRRNPAPTWEEFLASLAATNASLAADIAKLRTSLADYHPDRNYRP